MPPDNLIYDRLLVLKLLRNFECLFSAVSEPTFATKMPLSLRNCVSSPACPAKGPGTRAAAPSSGPRDRGRTGGSSVPPTPGRAWPSPVPAPCLRHRSRTLPICFWQDVAGTNSEAQEGSAIFSFFVMLRIYYQFKSVPRRSVLCVGAFSVVEEQ